MRLTKNKIVKILLSILGEEGQPLIEELIGKENVSEFDLAKNAKLDIKQVRKMLYLLYNNNLVSFTRKKDKQKGWYVYYWTLLPESVKFIYIKRKRELLGTLRKHLDEENKELFFVCSNNCVRLNFDQSMDFEFHCPECGELISQDDGKGKIEIIRKKILEIENELKKIEIMQKVVGKKKSKKPVKTKKGKDNKIGKKSATRKKASLRKKSRKSSVKRKKVSTKKVIRKKVVRTIKRKLTKTVKKKKVGRKIRSKKRKK